jgi:hypothetical protein
MLSTGLVVLGLLAAGRALADSGAIINLEEETGPATVRASGFLWSITSDRPADDLLKPLKPRLFRCCLTP